MKVLLTLFLGCLASASALMQCPEGWTYAVKKCYKFFPMPLPKEEAQIACTEIQGVTAPKLLDIKDYTTFQFIKNFYTHTLPYYQPPVGQQIDFIPPEAAIWNSLTFDWSLERWTGTTAATPFNRFNNFNSQPIGMPPQEPATELLSCTVYPAVEFPTTNMQPELTPLETPQQVTYFMTTASCETELPYICEASEIPPPTPPPTTPLPMTTIPWQTTPIPATTPLAAGPGVGGHPGQRGQPSHPVGPHHPPHHPPHRPYPGFPSRPRQPNRPGMPRQPNRPGMPRQPNRPGMPRQPGSPSQPNPRIPGFPSRPNPGTPGQPQFPSRPNPGTPHRPNQPVRYQDSPYKVRPYEYRYNQYIFSNKFGGLGIRM